MASDLVTPGWAAGLAILRARQESLAAAVAAALDETHPLPRLSGPVVTTGLGSSLGHARYLAWLLRTRCGLPAWDVPTGAFLGEPEPGAREQTLVVFSQGLSPNARFPLAHAPHYRRVVLVTAAEGDAPERARAVEQAREQGVEIVPLGSPPEYEVLIRIAGPAVGYAVALRLAIAAGAQLTVSGEAIAAAMRDGIGRARNQLTGAPPAVLSDPITLVTSGGLGAFAHNLAAKVQEGMYLPFPAVVDALELAHGTIQEASGKPRTFLALAAGGPLEASLFARARSTLEPQHRWLELEARLPVPLAIFEHEVMINEVVLSAISARRLDQGDWPGKGRDGPLYRLASTADLEVPAAEPERVSAPRSRRLAELTWPEIEQRIREGMRTVVVPLGAIEQHGPHLPLEVDSNVADALAERFCARVPEALQAPTLPFGCSEEHLAFPGTLSLSPRSFAGALGDLLASLARHGFEHLVVFSAHGGNDAPLAEAEVMLRQQSEPARLTLIRGIDRIGKLWQEASAREGISPRASGHHAGEFETSMIASLRPEAVRWREVRPGIDGDVPDPQRLFYPSLRDHAPEGVVGDPALASSERGERYLSAWTDLLVAEYRDADRAPAGRP